MTKKSTAPALPYSRASLTALLGIGAATSATGAIEYFGPENAFAINANGDDGSESFDWNIDGTGDADAYFRTEGSTGYFWGLQNIFTTANTSTNGSNNFGVQVAPGFQLLALNSGDNVSSGNNNYRFGNIVYSYVFEAQGFVDDTPGFFGFFFKKDNVDLYGWASITFDINNFTATVNEWAYEDSGAPIAVGCHPRARNRRPRPRRARCRGRRPTSLA